MALDKFLVREAPPTVYYIPNFITKLDEDLLIKNVYSSPKPKWTQLSNRRLQNWGGIPHPKGMIAEKIPRWLQNHMDKICEMGIFPSGKMPNHVLVNEYCPAQGIMPHTDGPLFYPTITTITCGSHTVLEFKKTLENDENLDKVQSKQNFALLLEPRSLVVVKNEVYEKYLHSIAEIPRDTISNEIVNLNYCENKFNDKQELVRGTRISLTIRHVPFTSKVLLRLSK